MNVGGVKVAPLFERQKKGKEGGPLGDASQFVGLGVGPRLSLAFSMWVSGALYIVGSNVDREFALCLKAKVLDFSKVLLLTC